MKYSNNFVQILHPRAVIGTNSWGSGVYEKVMRGNAVGMDGFRETMEAAKRNRLVIFDTARDYGNGKCPKILGELATDEICLSSKYTPFRRYKEGQVFCSVEKDLAYWSVKFQFEGVQTGKKHS